MQQFAHFYFMPEIVTIEKFRFKLTG